MAVRSESADEPGASPLQSASLLESLVAPLREGGRWSVLDIGPARPATLSFFRHTRCRLTVADALPGLAALGEESDPEPKLVRYRLKELLPVAAERPWQRVLLWDVLDYLPASLLEAFAARLASSLADGAVLHGFLTASGATVPADPPVYSILDDNRLACERAPGIRPAPRHSLWYLQRNMPGFVVDRSVLHRNGRQEHLIRFNSDTVAPAR